MEGRAKEQTTCSSSSSSSNNKFTNKVKNWHKNPRTQCSPSSSFLLDQTKQILNNRIINIRVFLFRIVERMEAAGSRITTRTGGNNSKCSRVTFRKLTVLLQHHSSSRNSSNKTSTVIKTRNPLARQVGPLPTRLIVCLNSSSSSKNKVITLRPMLIIMLHIERNRTYEYASSKNGNDIAEVERSPDIWQIYSNLEASYSKGLEVGSLDLGIELQHLNVNFDSKE